MIAKVRNATDAALYFQVAIINGGELEISPAVTYNAGDVFRVFSDDAIQAGVITGQFVSVSNADKWDISKLYTEGTVTALSTSAGVSQTTITDKKAYFADDILKVTGLQNGDKYSVYNIAGNSEDIKSKLPKGIYIVVIKGAKGVTSLKAINY